MEKVQEAKPATPGARAFQTYFGQAPPEVWRRSLNTHQGYWMMTPDGGYLGGSFSQTYHGNVADLMQHALEQWDRIAREKNLTSKPVPARAGARAWPEGAGLFLQVHSRDLPRGKELRPGGKALHRGAWNLKWLEFSREEARRFIPSEGRKAGVPRPIVEKMARSYLVDNVRDQEHMMWTGPKALKKAWVTTEVVHRTGTTVTVRLHGEVTAEQFWNHSRPEDRLKPNMMGYDCHLHGRAVFNTRAGTFDSFELVAAGLRKGSYSDDRVDDQEPAPMGVTFSIEQTSD